MRPQIPGKGISSLMSRNPSSYLPSATAPTNPAMLMCAGQVALQGAVPHFSLPSPEAYPCWSAISRSTSTTELNRTFCGHTKRQVSQCVQCQMASEPRSWSLRPLLIMWRIFRGSKPVPASLAGQAPVHAPQSKQSFTCSPPGMAAISDLNPG